MMIRYENKMGKSKIWKKYLPTTNYTLHNEYYY